MLKDFFASSSSSTTTTQQSHNGSVNYNTSTEHGSKSDSVIRDSMLIENCTVQDCFNVIALIEQYPEFIGVYSKVEILSWNSTDLNNRTVIAKYHVHTKFKNISYTLKVHQYCSGRQAQMRYELIEGPFSHHSGGWDLVQNGSHVEAHYFIDLQFSFGVPKMVRNWVMNSVLQSSMSSIKQRVHQTVSVK